jgi:CRP-like cAMP-binding protein
MQEPRIVKFPQDSVILREGEVNANMFKIIKGNAEMYTDYQTPTESILGIIGEQACFGEIGLLLGKPSPYTVIAYSDVFAMRITGDELMDFVAKNQRNIIEIMRNMAGGMMSMRLQIDLLLKDLQSAKSVQYIDLKERQREARRAMREYAIYSGLN